ncbi:ABC transporter permease [Pseudogemmobacter sp. W21_MBD1_M6]|uniref:ABC transporter permease n=1 Tax=Pseudogemmobacter sp. W21_MBD1_M6 TaxID=3240271 RepID=UPI003F98C187
MRPTDGQTLRLAVLALVMGGLVLPIAAGLWETGRAAFGILPAIGETTLSLDPWRRLAGLPGFVTSLRLTVFVGLASTLLSLALATGFCAAVHGRLSQQAGARMLTPFLAAPHAAIAIGLAFLIAPSGWLSRLVSPWATGWQVPPDIATVNDVWGLSLILGLMVKEVPFFLLVILAALGQLPVRQHLAAARALGYGRGVAWIKVIMPQVYPLIRLPIYIVLAFALSVVDVAIILGPSNPPVLAVAVTRWFTAPDTSLILPASAAAILQTGLVVAGIALWALAERAIALPGRWWIRRGGRGVSAEPGLWAASAATITLMMLGGLALIGLLVWSVAWRWPFPEPLPTQFSVRVWSNPAGGWGKALQNTALIGIASTAASLTLAIAWLEGEDRAGLTRARWAAALIYLPLLIPQIAFLYGLNTVFLRAGLSSGTTAVIWAQSLFVFPYVMIALSDPWRALDPRLIRAGAALGASPLRRLVTLKLPILLRPILTSAAIGFAVSVAQYLPTLFLGAGRVATLTTEAVTLSSGSDRRVVGTYAVLQAALPFAAYAAALLLPALIHRNRRDLNGAHP